MIKNLFHQFLNLKIKHKIFLSYVFIIFLTVSTIGIFSYKIYIQSITTASIRSSKYLMEQLSINFDFNIKAVEDFIFMQVFDSNLNKYIRINDDRQIYKKKRSIDSFSYTLLNFKSYIKAVLIADEYGNYYYNSYELPHMTKKEMEVLIDKENTQSRWGSTIWKPYSEDIIFVSRAFFDADKMDRIGTISVGIDTRYFSKLYRNIESVEGNQIIVLDENSQPLIISKKNSPELIDYFIENCDISDALDGKFTYADNEYMYIAWKSTGNKMKVINIINMGYLLKGAKLTSQFILGIGIIYIGFALIIAILLSESLVKNIRLLLGNIRKLGEGDFSSKIIPITYDEIGMLAIEFNSMSEKIQQLIETVAQEKLHKKNSEIKALQFEYDALQAKINPHFLYNTLETINSIAKIRGEEEISHMVLLLGRLLRESISNKRKVITLAEEVEDIKSYLELQQISYGNKINILFDLDKILMDAIVPKFILQPLVENAIIHGLEEKIGQGLIKIASRCEGEDMILEVSDDGIGIGEERLKVIFEEETSDTEHSKHTKIGVKSVDKRIKILYGEAYGLQIQSQVNKGTHITVRLPIIFSIEEE